ncbi:40S ribosomal protein S3-1 [Sparganum proliferum]
MAPTKQQQAQKGPKKGGKKKTADPFAKKECEGLKGRVIQLSLGDLNEKTQDIFRKFRLQVEDVQGRQCLTNFHGMDLTRDKLCGLVFKWQSTIEAHVDVKTTDGYTLRFFVIAFTKKQEQQKCHAYAQNTRIKKLRAKMVEVVQNEVARCDLKSVVLKLGAYVRKVKVLKKPKLDRKFSDFLISCVVGRLMELHGEGKEEEAGESVERADHYEPPVVNAV